MQHISWDVRFSMYTSPSNWTLPRY